MRALKKFLKLALTPVTIMVVPHTRAKPNSFKVPVAGVVLSVLLFLVGTTYIISVSVRTADYYSMQERLSHLSSQVTEWKSTMTSLKVAEQDFRRLFSLKAKEDVIKEAEFVDSGSLDMDHLNAQITEAMKSVTEIRTYIASQKSLYLSTPVGWPARGPISSGYGYREHPKSGGNQLHSGVDISVPPGTPVKATADGIISFSGWTPGSGNVVVIAHGHGFSTAYAHNQKVLKKIGERVRRGDAVAISGSTGVSTGPHVHYEIWENGRSVNPASSLARR